jgi:CHAD domain-containing protein
MTYSYTVKKSEANSETQILNSLRQNFTLIKELKQQGLCHYFDTFDWRLFRQDYHLYLFNHYLYLYQHSKKKLEVKENYHDVLPENFILLEGTIHNIIKPIIEVRALLCKATFRKSNQIFRVLNRDEKTIARIQLENAKIKERTKYKILDTCYEIQSLRGYANQIPGIIKKLSPGELSICKDDLLKRGLVKIGKIPADYSSKININLTNQMSALDATKQIYIYLLDIIRRNENGIINDIDIEFLHDFRVSIRRTRSALGQIKGVLDENKVLRAKENFAFLGRSTNKLRDIDVYLLREKKYKLMLPLELRQYLNPFFENLQEQRRTEQQSLVATLKSAKYKQILSDWGAYLLSKDIGNQRNKKVLKFGQQILTTGSDELLHQLRIEGKKLRYLLEFFNSLFVQDKIYYLIEKLKILQENLGEFNDLIVQQERLIDSAREITPRSRTGKNAVLALGILIGKLNEKQQVIKKEFAKSFSGYADPKVQKIFDELFHVQERHSR